MLDYSLTRLESILGHVQPLHHILYHLVLIVRFVLIFQSGQFSFQFSQVLIVLTFLHLYHLTGIGFFHRISLGWRGHLDAG